MAGKSPWGGKGSGGGGEGAGSDGGGDGGGDDSGPAKPNGPRNPWLPPGSGGEPRRSASIEDIFRNRGPEGPRRGGGGGRGPNFRLPERPGGKSWFPVILGGLVVVGLGMTMVHQIGPKEQAVVKTLGDYSRTLSPGLNFTLPFPVQTVDVEDVQGVRSVRIPDGAREEKLILTGDQNLVDLSYIVRWNIKDLRGFKYSLVEPIETVKEVAEAAMRASVAEKSLDQTFSGEGRAGIEQAVRQRMQQALDRYRSGIEVLGVEIDKADPPEEVNDAFKDVSVAEQNADAARNQARGYAQQQLSLARGEAQAFDKVYEQYRLAPEVTRQRLYYETMERVLSTTDKTIVEPRGVTPYLPLPEVRRGATAQPAAPATTVTGRQ
ncbi:protease modulator HflK [Parerythrobacter aurantius]|uniref:protease modulator HflK n=1 Tax=Parerythrobacter aurantius TaxID=3127706 RepID=UPI003247347E